MRPKDAFGRYGCVPRDMHPAWQRVSYFARALGRDLISRVDDFDSMRIETSGEWRTSLCLTLCINGPERRNAKGALDSLAEAGLLQTFDGFVVIGLQPLCTRSVSVPVPDSTQVTETPQVTSDSKLVSKQVERAAPAPARSIASRPDIVGFNFVASLLGRDAFSIAPLSSYPSDYSWIGTKQPTEREAVARAVNADPWCLENRGHVDAAHLVKGWQKYLEGRPKPVARVVAKPEPTGFWSKAGAQ